MFEAKQRQNFLDLLRPPPGYRLESALGTTYSLDFVALTAALLALVDAEPESDEHASTHTDSLHAITRLADRVRVFANRGRISCPHPVSKITVLYDRLVHEVCLPEGCFHPKVWITHYRPRTTPGAAARPGLVRVVCASRNLTTSQSWEAFIACEGREGGTRVAGSFNTGVREFLARLTETVPHPSSMVARLQGVVGRTTFDLPRPLRDEADFLWQWHDGPSLRRYLPARSRRALIVSPFVRKSFLEDILGRVGEVTLVSCQRELDAIADETFMARLCGGRNRVYVVEPADADGGGTAMDLHAKLMVFEDAGGSKTFLGSANASSSAWGGQNCEALVRFSPGVPIDHFCDRFIFKGGATAPGGRRPLQGWIVPYQRQPFLENEEDEAERHLQEICDSLARLQLYATYEPKTRCLRLALAATPPEWPATFRRWASSCDLAVGLLSQLHQSTMMRSLSDLLEGGVCFNDVGLTQLTEFLVIQVTQRRLGLQHRFILKANADFSAWRDQRDAEMLQELLTRDGLQAFLRAILFDAAVRPVASPNQVPDAAGGRGAVGTLLSDLSIEDILRQCTEDASRIDEIDRVLKAFEKTPWIDEDFRRFWATFVAAEAESRGGTASG